jgi:hypothetical protein
LESIKIHRHELTSSENSVSAEASNTDDEQVSGGMCDEERRAK